MTVAELSNSAPIHLVYVIDFYNRAKAAVHSLLNVICTLHFPYCLARCSAIK